LATWESLEKYYEAPDWFLDAKFGIYFHWGVYSVPAYGSEWYPINIHIENRREYMFHQEKYGTPLKFGYHDYVPLFKAENFNPGEWADLYVKAGARFVGPVAEHHDSFSMWDSKHTPWNSTDKGPKRDITGDLAQSIRSRGLKFITTFHHAR
jgi:alpha-L-fucosidase